METYAEYLLQLMSQGPSWGDLGLVLSFLSFFLFFPLALKAFYLTCLLHYHNSFEVILHSSPSKKSQVSQQNAEAELKVKRKALRARGKKRKSGSVPTLALPSQHPCQYPRALPQVCICFSKLGRKEFR